MKKLTILILCTLLFAFLMPAHAVGGAYAKKGMQEAIEAIAKAVSKEASDDAAVKLARETAEKLGKKLPEIGELLSKYGDDLGIVLRNEQRAKLFTEYGDDAAKAFIKNGNAAENALAKAPSAEMARLLGHVDRTAARGIDQLVHQGRITAAESKEWATLIREKGDGVISFALKNPKLTTAAAVTAAYAAYNPEGAMSALSLLKDTVVFALGHPILAVLILLALGTAYVSCVRLMANSPRIIINWLGRKLGGNLFSKSPKKRKT